MKQSLENRVKDRLVRNIEASEHIETFLVTAVTSILSIRLYLEMMDYPQLGSGGLHIAHMLWGGLLMASAIMILILFVGNTAERWAAVIGGMGFGTFIDEIGKFVTQDNNYFYEPSVALMYTTFIVLVLFVRAVGLRGHYSQMEFLVNALRKTEEIARRDLDKNEKTKALHYLDQCKPTDPLVLALKELLQKTDPVPIPQPRILRRVKDAGETFYDKLTRLPGFNLGIIIFFSAKLFLGFLYLAAIILLKGLNMENMLKIKALDRISVNINGFSFIEWGELISSFLSALFIFWGFVALKKSRLAAYQMFEKSILVTIFVTQVFMFYQDEFGALFGLVLNLFLLFLLRTLIRTETRIQLDRIASVTS